MATRFLALAALLCAMPAAASADGATASDALAGAPPAAPVPSDWSVTIGGGALAAPAYPGAASSRLMPLPFADVRYRHLFFLSPFAGFGVNAVATRRLQILDETITVVKRLWTEETVTFDGKHLHFDGAYCDPKPLQNLPPVWVGGGGEKVTLAIAAREADATNWQVGLDSFVHKSDVLRAHCERIGREFDTIVRTHGPDCRLFDTEADLARWLDSPGGGGLWGGGDPEEYVRDNLVGTAEQVAEKVQAFVDAGCREFVLWFRDYPSTDSLEGFASDVVPRVSA